MKRKNNYWKFWNKIFMEMNVGKEQEQMLCDGN